MDNLQTIRFSRDEDAFHLVVVKNGKVTELSGKLELNNPTRLKDAAEYAKSGVDGMILNENNS